MAANTYDRKCAKCSADDAYEYVATIKPTVSTGVAKLTELASVCIASSLWNHENIPLALSRFDEKCVKKSQKWLTLRNKIFKLPGQLPIPRSVAEDLSKYVWKMEKEITDWVSYHLRKIFLKKGQDDELYNLIHLIAWYPDATINCKLTAKNMLTCVRLSDVQKFRFLCTYCLKNEMEQMSSKVFSNNFMDYVEFPEHPLIFYWNCYFRNELNKIPAAGNINIFMFRHPNVDHWTAKEYFFDLLSPDDQVQQAIWLIDAHDVLYQSPILMKLNETQRLLVYLERAVKILLSYVKFEGDYEKFLSTWSDIHNMITQQEFVSLFHDLLEQSDNEDVFLIDIWSRASDDFKLYLFNYNNHEIFDKVLRSWKWSAKNRLLFKMLSFASPCSRKDLIEKEFFITYCENLLAYEKIMELDRLLKCWLPENEELIEFKQNLVLKSKSIRTRCLNYYSSGDLDKVDDLLQILSPKLIVQYKKELLMSSDGILKYVIRNSSIDPVHVVSTIENFRHLMAPARLVFLFCELVKARPVDEILTKIWDMLPHDMKLSLFSYKNHEVIEKVFKSLEGTHATEFVFILLQDVTFDVRKEITKKPFFKEYCEKLLSTKKFELMTRLINFCLPGNEELTEFKMNFFNNSKSFEDRCFSYFSSGNSESLFEFLGIFSLPDPDLFLEIRKNLLMSDAGMEHCVDLFNSPANILVLNTIIEDTFRSDAVLAMEFKKNMIFLPSVLRKLRILLESGYFEDVQNCLDQYLTSAEDKKAIKMRLFGDPVKEMRRLLVKNDENYWKSCLMWYFEDEKLVEQFRAGLGVDTIFIEMLQDCIFEKFSLTPRCKYKFFRDIKFECLDSFLLWYFRAPDCVKKYKLGRINSFKNTEMFQVLLKKPNDRYLKAVMEWFFQNDQEEIENFKAKYGQENEDVYKMILLLSR